MQRVPDAQRDLHGEHSAPRLCDGMARSGRQAFHEPAEEVIQRVDARIGGEAAEARVVEEVDETEVAPRLSERGPSASAGKEDERRHRVNAERGRGPTGTATTCLSCLTPRVPSATAPRRS